MIFPYICRKECNIHFYFIVNIELQCFFEHFLCFIEILISKQELCVHEIGVRISLIQLN